MMDSIQRSVLDQKIRGWEWIRSELRRLRAETRAEIERLLGPDRGE